ncbi:pathogenesis-related thaumatin-like protein 3.5 [Gastrolobium bilobum]|uniref:pathogenesis-related thaumatin-like protein 3.5 n=1 Tax=Gastrolobium bilobum TaxID=150636 RepID=UPI002AB053D1|nr:pathogenesis-related thaumatin-like protein 3.5 [Gastrolobium bilobum]
MQLSGSIAALLFLVIWPSIFYGIVVAHQVTFYVQNKCPFPIWPATAPNNGQPVIAGGGFYLAPGQTQRIVAPWSWSGRIWARTGCNFASNWKPACETGDCDGRLACNGLIGTPPVTLVEVSLQGDKGKPNFYDVSLVDGYNIPVSVTPKIINPTCSKIQGCLKDLKSLCPHELEVLNNKGEVVACSSACLAFDNDKFCCRNEYGSPEKCKANVYSKIFKEVCPNYFSYAFDTPSPLRTCGSLEYIVTFCPSGWGGAVEHKSE